MNLGEVNSEATFWASVFLPGICLADLFCLVQDVSWCPPLSCPIRWRPWPDSQGAVTAVTSLWQIKKFLSSCTAGIINLNYSKQNLETKYHKYLLSILPSYVVKKYPLIYTHKKGWKTRWCWEQRGGTTGAVKRMHSAKRQLCFRDCSTSSSTEGSWGRFGTFYISVMAPELSQTCHTPPMLVRLLLWVLIAPAGFLARRKTSMFSSPFFLFTSISKTTVIK